jgi:ribosome-associated protein
MRCRKPKRLLAATITRPDPQRRTCFESPHPLRFPTTRFIRASGPGGQNVNKVASAVELRFDAAGSPSLPEALRTRLLARRDRRITEDGVVVITAQRFRTQDRNRQDARERLAGMILSVLKPPKPRIATKPTRGSKERRLTSKRERAGVKRQRASRGWDSD